MHRGVGPKHKPTGRTAGVGPGISAHFYATSANERGTKPQGRPRVQSRRRCTFLGRPRCVPVPPLFTCWTLAKLPTYLSSARHTLSVCPADAHRAEMCGCCTSPRPSRIGARTCAQSTWKQRQVAQSAVHFWAAGVASVIAYLHARRITQLRTGRHAARRRWPHAPDRLQHRCAHAASGALTGTAAWRT